MTDLESDALAFATFAHRDQVRKYTSRPYVEHCMGVREAWVTLEMRDP
jgi:hypothetical protein